jgi:hypothetical protein
MMNITRRSTSSAERNAPEASRQVQIWPRSPTTPERAGRKRVDARGLRDHHLDLVGRALAVEVGLRLGERHVDAGAVDVEAPDAEDVDDLVVVDARLGAERRVEPLGRDQRDDVADPEPELARDPDPDRHARIEPVEITREDLGCRDQRHVAQVLEPRADHLDARAAPERRRHDLPADQRCRMGHAGHVTEPRGEVVEIGDQPARHTALIGLRQRSRPRHGRWRRGCGR